MLISSARLALALEKKWEKKDTGNVKKKSIEEEKYKISDGETTPLQ